MQLKGLLSTVVLGVGGVGEIGRPRWQVCKTRSLVVVSFRVHNMGSILPLAVNQVLRRKAPSKIDSKTIWRTRPK